jgi:general secretion pathway protein G
MSTMERKRERGITLVELLVVMVIIAMFATMIGARMFKSVDKAKQVKAQADIHELESTLDMFRLDVGRYPTTEEGLQALRTRPSGLENWDGPYIKRDLTPDPWGKPYFYRCPGQHGDFDLMSYGFDGQEGGEGNNMDIVNW